MSDATKAAAMRDPDRRILKRARRVLAAALAQRDPSQELVAAAELVCEVVHAETPDP